MAKLSYSEWLNQKKEGASAPSISDAPANKPATNTQITGSNGSSGEKPSYSEWLSARREKEATESVDGWINQSINTLNSINNYYSSWRGGDDPQYGAYQQQLSKYLSQADNWRKMYSGNEDAIAAINEVVSYLSGAKYNTMAIKDFYSRWGTEEDYLKWDAYRTPESRQARYEENQRKLEELREERKEAAGSTSILSVMGFSDSSLPIAQQSGSNSRLQEIDDEIAAIETEMRMYERGGTDENGFYYGAKVIDDYGKLRDNADFGAVSGIRAYTNASKEELDSYDASQSEGSLALNNGGYYDEQGNIRDKKGNIVQYANAPAVEDKLGMFLAASDEDIADAYNLLSVVGGNFETTWADIMQEGETQRWKYLTDGEIDIYYYLLGSQGQEAAYKYLDDMEVELGRRENEETYAAIEGANGWEKAGLSALSVIMNMAGGVASTVDNASRLIQGKELNPYSRAQSLTNASGYIRSATARDIIEATGGAEIPGLGFSAGDAYQAGMSMIDSLVGARLGGTAYQAIMSMGAASSEANRLYGQGASTDQIILGSAAAGTAEWFFEKYSIENLISMKSPETIGQFLKNAFIQGGIEFSEEAATEIANIISNGLIMQSQSDWEKLLEENDGDYGAAIKEMAIQVTNAGLGGFLSGFGSGAFQQGIAYGTQQKQNRQIGQYISGGDGTDALMALAMDMASGSDGKSQRGLRSQVDALKADNFLTKGGRNRATGRLYNTVRSVMTEQNIGEISAALQEQGFSKKDASKIAGALAMNYNGIELTAQQEKLVQKYGNDQKVLDAISKVVENGESGIRQRANSMARFEFGTMLGNAASRMKQDAPGQEKTAAEGNLSGENSVAQTASYEVSDDGQTRLISDPEKVVSVVGIASLENGKVMLQLKDGSTVDAEDVSFGDSGDALIYSTVAGLGLSVDTANTIIGAFDSGKGVSAQMYSMGLQEAYRNGKYNYAFQSAENDPYSDAMKLAWNEGRMSALSESRRRQAEADAKYSEAKKKQTGNEKSGEHQAVLEKGITAMSLNESQKASYRLADSIAQAAKVDIIVYAGKTGELGFYDPNTDTIHLNLNGMNKSRKSMMAFTLGHELVHRAKEGSPAKYQAFADFLVENYGKRGADLEAMIAEQLDAAKKFGIKMSRDEAFEEVVCDACQRMLLDTDAGKKLAQFGAESRQNKSILSEIKRWIEEFMQKLREIFAGVEPDSLAAKEFAKFDDGVKQILADMYVDMTVDAGEHLSTIQEAFGKDTIVRTNEQGEFTVAESRDGSGKVFNLTTWENGGRETLEAALLREGYTREEVDAALTIMDEKQKLVEAIANEVDGNGKPAFPEQGRINEATLTTDIKDGHAVLSSLVSNGDYPVNIDLLMVCKKRKAYQRVINRLCETGMIKQATVDALAIAEINKILGKYGFETACLGCFVESRRLRIQEWAQTIVREWNGEVKKRNPNAKAFGFGKGEATLTSEEVMQLVGELESGGKKNEQGNLNLGQGSAVKRMGVLLDKVPSLRRTLSVEDLITPDGLSALRRFDGNLFSMVKSRYGSNSPKFVQEFNPYNHELAKYGKVPSEYKSLREYLYAIGGARMQSFSDFIVENWFDYCQIVADLAARKLPMHTYTKEIALAKLFGMTGIKINMSLIPDVDRSLGKEYAGLTRNANGELELIWADKDRFKATGGKSYMQSINFADAVALQNDPRYSANVGTIAIGISDMQIRMMLADPRIRMVIPYHSSGMNPIYADLMGTSFYKDYTNFQNTTVKQLYNSKGQPVSLKLNKTQVGKLTGGFLFNSVLQELGDARAAADAYIEWCADASKHTITINGQTYTAELTPKFADFASEENYYKLLEDFNTYDCVTEEAAPQMDVQQVYPDGFEDILRSELSGQERYRQKQEKNQAFDKAMGEIEGYLNSHTKADTVYYAEQHGVKLGAKDKKLGADDKARLKKMREDGVSFALPKSDQVYMDAVERGDMETAQRMVNERAEQLRADVFAQTDVPTYRVRRGPTPKKTITVYKVFTMSRTGKPSALFVSSNFDLPVGVWLDAQDTYHFTDQRNGHMYVPSTKNPNTKGGATGRPTNVSDISTEDIAELEKRGYLKRDKNGNLPKTITSLAYRPGWHAGDLPFFPQGGMQIEGSNYPNVHRYNQVVFECEMIADNDYTDYHVTDDGKVQLHDMQQMPDNGSYKYSTNPMAQSSDIGAWYIGSSIKIVRALTQAECDRILQEKGRPVQEWQAYQDADELKRVKDNARSRYTDKKTRDEAAKAAEYAYEHRYGALDLDALGYDPTQTDGGKKLLDAVTYDDDGNVIPLSQRFNSAKQDVRYSLPKTNSPYSYESLISKPDMVVTTVGGNVPNNRADVAHIAKQNAAKVGRFDPKTGSVSVHVADIDTDVILSTKGLRHGLRRTNDPLNVPNYIVTVKAGEILKNSIRINEITPSDENARSSYVLIGAARDANGTYVVRFVVNHFDNSVSSMDVLYAVNAKKEPAATKSPRLAENPLSVTGSTISISKLLDIVNQYFPDILPEEALKHYGYDARPEGDLGADALYKLPVGDDTSPRALLANAYEELAKTDAEKESIRKYQERVVQFQELETKLKDLRAQIRELYTADGKLDTKKIRELQFEANATANRIETLDRMLLRTESTQQFQNVLKREQDQARAREIKKAKDAVIAFRHDASAEIRETMRDYEAARSALVGRDRLLQKADRLGKRVEGRNKTVVRNKIKAIGDEFHKMLTNPGKAASRHAPRNLIGAVTSVCDLLAESNERMNVRLFSELVERQKKLNEKVEERGLTKTRQEEADIISRKNARIVEATKKVKALQEQYAKMKGDPDNGIFYDEHIENLIDQLTKVLFGTDIYDMTMDQLRDTYNTLNAIRKAIVDANKVISMGETKRLSEVVRNMSGQIDQVNVKANGLAIAARRYMMWQMSPDTFFDYICGYIKGNEGQAVQKMFSEGTRRMLSVQREFDNRFQHIFETENKDNLKYIMQMTRNPMKETVDWGLKDASGNQVRTSRGMMIQAYMLLKQKDSFESIIYGGLKIPKAEEYYKGNIDSAYGDASYTELFSESIGENVDSIQREIHDLKKELDEEGLSDSRRNELNNRIAELEQDGKNLVSAAERRATELLNAIEKKLTAFDREIIKTADEWYRYSGKLMSEVFEGMYGYAPALVDNYVPIHRDLGSVKIDIREADAEKAFNLENSGFTKERVKSKAPILLTDFFVELNNQKSRISRYYGFAQVQKDFNRIWNMRIPGSRMTLKEKVGLKFGKGDTKTIFGVSGEKYVEHYINSIAGVKRQAGLFDGLYGNMASATLSLNPRVAFSQLASIPTASAVVGWKSMAVGFTKGIQTSFSKDKKRTLAQNSEWFYTRYKGAGGVTEIAELNARGGIWSKVASSKVGKWFFNWCQTFDVLATSSMWAMAEDYVQAKGFKADQDGYQAEVARVYEDIIRKSQPNYTETERSDFLRDKRSGMKLFNMYKTQSNQNLNILLDANGTFIRMKRDLKNGLNGVTKSDVQAAGVNLANAVTSVTIGGTLTFVALRTLINFLFGWVKPYKDDETDEVTEEETINGIVKEIFSSLSGMFALGGTVFDFVSAVVSGEKFYGLTDSAISAISDVVENSAETIQMFTDSDKDFKWSQIENQISSVLTAFGVPYNNVRKIIDSAAMWYRDIRDGKFGQYSSTKTTDRQYMGRIVVGFREGDDEKCKDVLAYLIAKSDAENEEDAQEDVLSSLKTYLRDLYIDKDVTKDEVSGILKTYFGVEDDDLYWLFDEWDYAAENGSSEGYGKFNELYAKMLEGKDITDDVKKFTDNGYELDTVETNIREQIKEFAFPKEGERKISNKQAEEMLVRYGGMTPYDARERVADWQFEADHGYAYSDIKATYMDDVITRSEAISVMMSFGGKTRDEAEKKIKYWDYEENTGVDYENKASQYRRGIITRQQLRKALIDIGEYTGDDADSQIEAYDWENGGINGATLNRVKNWHQYLEKEGVSKSVWMSVSIFAATVKGDKKSDGSPVPGSKAKKIMEKINSMNISRAQKDALALAIGEQENWSAKTIAKYKLW